MSIDDTHPLVTMGAFFRQIMNEPPVAIPAPIMIPDDGFAVPNAMRNFVVDLFGRNILWLPKVPFECGMDTPYLEDRTALALLETWKRRPDDRVGAILRDRVEEICREDLWTRLVAFDDAWYDKVKHLKKTASRRAYRRWMRDFKVFIDMVIPTKNEQHTTL